MATIAEQIKILEQSTGRIYAVRFANLDSVVFHATDNVGKKTFCGRATNRQAPNEWLAAWEVLPDSWCLNCRGAIRKMQEIEANTKTAVLSPAVLSPAAVVNAAHAANNRDRYGWGGSREGAGRPKEFERVPVDYLNALEDLASFAGELAARQTAAGIVSTQRSKIRELVAAIQAAKPQE